jgi:hypothetical protein
MGAGWFIGGGACLHNPKPLGHPDSRVALSLVVCWGEATSPVRGSVEARYLAPLMFVPLFHCFIVPWFRSSVVLQFCD